MVVPVAAPEHERGRPRQDGPTQNHNHHNPRPHSITGLVGVPIVAADTLPPAGRRTLDAFVVKGCPFCAGMHIHRGLGIRTPTCAGGRAYVVIGAEVQA